jgi:hypothetical protein
MGVDADWHLLNRLLIDAPAEDAREQAESLQKKRHVYKYEEHLKLILDALRDKGVEPKALPPREDGKGTPKAMVRKILVEPNGPLIESQFKHSWEHGRSVREIDEVTSVTI